MSGASDEFIFVVVATPVEEIGRDHDFDWAVVEPSSIHSIIQTAGRVNRHRLTGLANDSYNIVLLSHNIRALRGKDKMCFVRPGLERENERGGTTHPDHDMVKLMETVSGIGGASVDNILDAGLVFDERREVRFSRYDREAIRLCIEEAMPVFECRPGYHLGFVLEDFAKRFPLRDRGMPQTVVIDTNTKEFRLCGAEHKIGKVGILDLAPQNTWLCPSELPDKVHAMINLNREADGTMSELHIDWNGLRSL